MHAASEIFFKDVAIYISSSSNSSRNIRQTKHYAMQLYVRRKYKRGKKGDLQGFGFFYAVKVAQDDAASSNFVASHNPAAGV
jgi:hypothetical protein